MWRKVQTPSSWVGSTLACDGLSVPRKARRREVDDTSSETEHRSWSFGVLEVTEGHIKMIPSGIWAQ